MKILAAMLRIGDVIMPPPRDVQLWMRRECKERGLPESALHLTITGIEEAYPDDRGPWLLVTADQTAEWNAGSMPLPFKFKVRPGTLWETIKRAA